MTKAAIGLVLVDESATVALGRLLFSVIDEHCFHQGVVSIFLHGDLGMGKTTLTRGILEGAGH
ncbi:tRNA (adenosine(37)-N6)-threonylcarbamoyltransferase complex ATPase subunit type 1 TsaE, partial [Oleiphilus sp. HI0132]